MIQFDGSHIFQMGWFNHQAVKISKLLATCRGVDRIAWRWYSPFGNHLTSAYELNVPGRKKKNTEKNARLKKKSVYIFKADAEKSQGSRRHFFDHQVVETENHEPPHHQPSDAEQQTPKKNVGKSRWIFDLRVGARRKKHVFFFSVKKQRVIHGVATCGDEPKNSLEV